MGGGQRSVLEHFLLTVARVQGGPLAVGKARVVAVRKGHGRAAQVPCGRPTRGLHPTANSGGTASFEMGGWCRSVVVVVLLLPYISRQIEQRK